MPAMYVIKQEPEDFTVRELSSIVPQIAGRYTYFLLRKRNYTTEAAIQRIAKQLRMPRRFFGFAGNKDKRGITEQLCSMSGNLRSFELKEISVEAVGRGDSPISLGDLYGNRFEIVVRNIAELPRKVSRVVNYFDSQRFGINENNHLVGRSILKRDFRGAVEQIIESKEEMISHLKQYPNDYIGALRLLPRKVMSMYINAYQSDIWNRGVKEYIAGRKVEENEEFPLVGFGTEVSNPAIKGIVERLLAADGVKQRDFVMREIPELTSEGNSRRIFADVRELSVGKLEEDELNSGMKKVRVKFTLGRGSYATIVIKEMFSGL
jgi:tRNA pseudouridine13 synthase